jgi:hypothetical protein
VQGVHADAAVTPVVFEKEPAGHGACVGEVDAAGQ